MRDPGRHGAIVPVLDLLSQLERFYGPLPTPPNDPFRYYVWEVLSTQTTPGRRDAAYAALQRVPALTPDSVFRAPRGKLVAAIARAGSYQEQRLHALFIGADRFRRQPGLSAIIRSSLRQARRLLADVPQLGDASVHRLLLFGGDHCVLPMDLDMERLVRRIGVDVAGSGRPGGTARRMLRRAVERELPRDPATFRRAALYLRHHSQQTCTDDPHCNVCPIAANCAAARPSD